ncbi:hypothetical protein ACFE04_001485 [Oxalis oulophora]
MATAFEAPPKKTRGPTRCLHIWDAKHPIIRVEVNANGIPIGKEGSTLTRFLGIIARKGDLAPLDYFDWRDLPKTMKDHMWRIVEQISEINTENRSKSDEPHNAGTMSFARLAEEMGKDKDRLPEPWEIYVKTRSKQDGTFTSVRAREVVKNIHTHVNEIRSQETFVEGETAMPSDLLAQAMNKPEQKGRERCVGSLPPGRKRRKSTFILQPLSSLRQEYEILKMDNEKLKNENAEMKITQEKLQSELGRVSQTLSAVTEKLGLGIEILVMAQLKLRNWPVSIKTSDTKIERSYSSSSVGIDTVNQPIS